MQPYVSKARPKRTEGCRTVSFKYLFAPVERLRNNEIFRHKGHPKFFPLSVHRLTSVYPLNVLLILRISAHNSLLLERMGWCSLYVFNYISLSFKLFRSFISP